MQEVEEDRCQRGVGGRQVEGVKDEDERIRWEARRCHFGNGEREKKQVARRHREKMLLRVLRSTKKALSVRARLSAVWIVCCRDRKRTRGLFRSIILFLS